MLRFALKHMAIRLGKNVLIALSIIITLTVSLLAYNIANQVKDGIIGTYKYYDTIIGPSGSQTQLVLNTMFFTDRPLGTIPYEKVTDLSKDQRVAVAIPFAMGDNYNGARIVGTDAALLDGYHLSKGKPFSEPFEAVIGFDTAKKNKLNIGDTFYSVHGLADSANSHHHDDDDQAFIVAGILSKTNTAADHVIFTDIRSVWLVHDHEDEHEDDHDETDHDEQEYGDVTAILLRCSSLSAQMALSQEVNDTAGLQAVNPSMVMRDLLNNVDLAKNIVYILCVVILMMNFFIICVITMLNMTDIRKDITLFRLIGVSKGRIELIITIQTALIVFTSVLAGFAASRLLMPVIEIVTRSMGVVLNAGKFYPLEISIMGVVMLMTWLPISFAVNAQLRKEINHEK